MNEAHLAYCSSDEWADALKRWMIPGALEHVTLGDDVLEIGPGPGRTTDILKDMAPRLTAVEIDADLAAKLSERMAGTNVEVLHADATDLPLPDGRFSAALSFTMLHHVPSIEAQDRLFAEVARVLRPGGVLAGIDSLDTPEWREMHIGDVCVPVDPATLSGRLSRAGFSQVAVEPNPYVVQFRATV
jgi:SAM-dependent methyltransferase